MKFYVCHGVPVSRSLVDFLLLLLSSIRKGKLRTKKSWLFCSAQLSIEHLEPEFGSE